ncbi:MAG TPA: CDP-diacylglycerol--glycerol-3-phosphate 3-phosphatidyltransferase [Bauldia sp.]|nr:CDP-diacylglycerol--glycerol-3-phosphate 3-phosphatidyltransferase [Bauldia sp.]
MADTPALPAYRRASTSQVFALPNLLTYFRVLAVPLLVASYYLEGYIGRWLSLTIFLIACVSDFFDGYLARVWKQTSALGRLLDPIADKLLVATSLMLLVSDHVIGGWSLVAALIILTREIFVSGLREFLAELRVPVPVTRLAKWKTTLQMVAIGFLLVAPAGNSVFPGVLVPTPVGTYVGPITFIGLTLLWISALITLYTGYDYFRAGWRHLFSEEE